VSSLAAFHTRVPVLVSHAKRGATCCLHFTEGVLALEFQYADIASPLDWDYLPTLLCMPSSRIHSLVANVYLTAYPCSLAGFALSVPALVHRPAWHTVGK
jgi:hypothetical protein